MPRTRRKQSTAERKLPEEVAPVAAATRTLPPEPIVEEHAVAVREPEPGGAAEEQGLTPRQLAERVTLEAAVYGLLLIFSFALRLIDLGARPLAGHEATSAWAAWQFLQGQGLGTSPSPFLFSANLLTFALGAPTDLSARLVPAIMGGFGVLLPLLVRRELGRGTALLASTLLLFSTSLVYFARDANGTEIAAVAGTAASIWFLRYASGRRSRDAYLAAIAGAVALTSDSAAFTVLLGLLVALFLVRRNGRQDTLPASQPDGHEVSESGTLRKSILTFTAFYIAIATVFLINREGLGSAFDLFGRWLLQFGSLGGFLQPASLLLLYEPLILLLGLAGLISLPWRGARGPGERLLLYFGCAALAALVVYSLAGEQTPADMIVVVLPLSLLAAWFLRNMLERAFAEIASHGGWHGAIIGEIPVLAVGLAISILFYLQFASLLTRPIFWTGVEAFRQFVMPSSAPGAFEPAALLLSILALVITFFVLLMAYALIGGARTANLAALFVVVLLGAAGLRALWIANYATTGIKQEPIAGDQAPLDVRDLVQELESQSAWRAGDAHVMAIQADPELGPVVRWYLRAFPNVDWSTGLPGATRAEAVIEPEGASAPPGNWMGTKFAVSYAWQFPDASRSDLFKWLVFRTGGVGIKETAVLWVLQPQAQ